MNNIWAFNNTLKEEKDILKIDCSFRQFVYSDFFNEFAKITKTGGLLFTTETDKIKINWEEEFYDSWGIVKFYLNGSKKPNFETVSENIDGITLVLNLKEFEGENVITFMGKIKFHLNEIMWQKLVDAYNDYYDNYFPNMIHKWEESKTRVKKKTSF